MVAGLVADIGGRQVVAEVKSKEKAEEKYEDAIASGNTAVMAKRTDKSLVIDLGNLPNGQEALIKLTLLTQIYMEGVACTYQIPVSSFPDYA